MAERRPEFIARREWAGYTQETLAQHLAASIVTISSWERGISKPGPRFRRPLADALGVTLVELDRLLGDEHSIELTGHLVQKWLTHYGSLVVAAGRVVAVDLLLVTGLLQTRRYATALERTTPGVTDEQVDERVDNRLARQKVLRRRTDPLRLTALIDETVLLSRIGGTEVTVEQLQHLIEVTRRRTNVDVRILPADGTSAPAVSTFELLTSPDDDVPFMAYTTDASGPNYHEGFKIKPFIETYRELIEVALSPADSIEVIEQIKAFHLNGPIWHLP